MGKKNKKEKRGKGAEKTKLKTEKKAEKRLKKELEDKGEGDIERLIAEHQEQDRKRKVEVVEEKCPPPSPRCNISLVAHPDKEELLMFGGEYFTGNKMNVYNDLFVYQIKKKEWLKVSVPNPPPPRGAHQAVTLPQQGGQMWLFGGEFSSHSQSQFYHYKDLWLLHLREKRWEQIKCPGGPSARSGHRMAALKKKLFVFGGFHDNVRDYKYFSDVHIFDTETYTWTLITPSGTAPSPRSGCVLLSVPEGGGRLVVYGGYSKEKKKKDMEAGKTFVDMYTLALDKKKDSDTENWKWQSVKQTGMRPSQRSGMSGVVAPGSRAFLFGGVFDEDEEDDDLDSHFYKDLWTLDMDKAKWFQGRLRGKKAAGQKKRRRRKGKDGQDESDEDDGEEMEGALESLDLDHSDKGASSVFTVTQSSSSGAAVDTADTPMSHDDGMETESFWPSPRMNASLAMHNGVMYMYGGIVEDGDKQVTLADFYSLDVSKLDEWSVIIAEDRKLQEWQDSDDDDDDEMEVGGAKSSNKRSRDDDSDDDDDDDDDSDDSLDITFDDAPDRPKDEAIRDYFIRTQDYWVGKAKTIAEEDGDELSMSQLRRFAKEICEEACM